VLPSQFTPASAAELIDRFGVTHVNGSDDMLIAIIRQGGKLTSWRYGVQAEFTGHGERAVASAEERAARIAGVYGSSETFALLAMRAPEKPLEQRWRAGGIFAAGGMQVRIAEAGDPAEASAAMGEIQFRGPSLPDAYLQADGTLPPALTDDGWFPTGHLGHLDEDGGFTYVARKDDALRLAGFLVDPAEIERFLEHNPGVTQAQVVGVVKTTAMKSLSRSLPPTTPMTSNCWSTAAPAWRTTRCTHGSSSSTSCPPWTAPTALN
jgi:acyl-CoA synthetase (AMP-forming)/AMP-acid ligase II